MADIAQMISYVFCSGAKIPREEVRVGHAKKNGKEVQEKLTTAGLEPATFWCASAIEAKRATIALGSHDNLLRKQK
jgi:hypothetical protein